MILGSARIPSGGAKPNVLKWSVRFTNVVCSIKSFMVVSASD